MNYTSTKNYNQLKNYIDDRSGLNKKKKRKLDELENKIDKIYDQLEKKIIVFSQEQEQYVSSYEKEITKECKKVLENFRSRYVTMQTIVKDSVTNFNGDIFKACVSLEYHLKAYEQAMIRDGLISKFSKEKKKKTPNSNVKEKKSEDIEPKILLATNVSVMFDELLKFDVKKNTNNVNMESDVCEGKECQNIYDFHRNFFKKMKYDASKNEYNVKFEDVSTCDTQKPHVIVCKKDEKKSKILSQIVEANNELITHVTSTPPEAFQNNVNVENIYSMLKNIYNDDMCYRSKMSDLKEKKHKHQCMLKNLKSQQEQIRSKKDKFKNSILSSKDLLDYEELCFQQIKEDVLSDNDVVWNFIQRLELMTSVLHNLRDSRMNQNKDYVEKIGNYIELISKLQNSNFNMNESNKSIKSFKTSLDKTMNNFQKCEHEYSTLIHNSRVKSDFKNIQFDCGLSSFFVDQPKYRKYVFYLLVSEVEMSVLNYNFMIQTFSSRFREFNKTLDNSSPRIS